jgi:hypothetical protein
MTELADGAADEQTFTAWLIAHGRRPWTEIRPLLSGCMCAWADLDGFHAEAPPAEPPLATHLWAWDADKLLRIRIDGSDGIAAELLLGGASRGERVEVTRREAVSWPLGEGRVSVQEAWRNRVLRVYEVAGLMPLEFTRLEADGQQGEETDR